MTALLHLSCHFHSISVHTWFASTSKRKEYEQIEKTCVRVYGKSLGFTGTGLWKSVRVGGAEEKSLCDDVILNAVQQPECFTADKRQTEVEPHVFYVMFNICASDTHQKIKYILLRR